LTLDGELPADVGAGLKALVGVLDVQLISADTFGRLDNIAAQLGMQARDWSLDDPRRVRRRTWSSSWVPSGSIVPKRGLVVISSSRITGEPTFV
jgi:hypothetical protein